MSERLCLIVDDEPVIRSVVGTILQARGFQSLEAENAAEAFGIVQRLAGRVDLIITDILMPGDMDGLELAHTVRRAFPKIPIILISGYPMEGFVTRAEFPLVAKPFEAETIWKAIERALNLGEHEK